MLAIIIVAVVCIAVGYFVAPRVVGVARKEYDATVEALVKEQSRIEAKIDDVKAGL